MRRLHEAMPNLFERAAGRTGALVAAASATLGVALLLAGTSLQRAFDPAVIGALALVLWPAWLFGAVLVVLGVAAFGLAVLSVAATAGLALVRKGAVRVPVEGPRAF